MVSEVRSGFIYDRLKDWLGIKALEDENLRLARALIIQRDRIDAAENDAKRSLEVAEECKNSLTSASPKPKIVPKPHRANWRTFRAAAEKASELEEQEA